MALEKQLAWSEHRMRELETLVDSTVSLNHVSMSCLHACSLPHAQEGEGAQTYAFCSWLSITVSFRLITGRISQHVIIPGQQAEGCRGEAAEGKKCCSSSSGEVAGSSQAGS